MNHTALLNCVIQRLFASPAFYLELDIGTRGQLLDDLDGIFHGLDRSTVDTGDDIAVSQAHFSKNSVGFYAGDGNPVSLTVNDMRSQVRLLHELAQIFHCFLDLLPLQSYFAGIT